MYFEYSDISKGPVKCIFDNRIHGNYSGRSKGICLVKATISFYFHNVVKDEKVIDVEKNKVISFKKGWYGYKDVVNAFGESDYLIKYDWLGGKFVAADGFDFSGAPSLWRLI